MSTLIGYLIGSDWQVVVIEKEVDEEILMESKDKTEDYRSSNTIRYRILLKERKKMLFLKLNKKIFAHYKPNM